MAKPKLEKPKKARKRRVHVPADQVMVRTTCELCRKSFPSPTHGAAHIGEVHS